MLVFFGIVLGILIFILGSMIFSFLNVVIYRLPRGENFIRGRSRCPACGHSLTFSDMMPIISWVRLRGRCRYCKVRISFRYTVVEALGGAAALGSVLVFGFSAHAALTFAMCCVLVCVAFIDYDTMEIPDIFNLIAAGIGVLSIFITDYAVWYEHLIGLFVISVPMLIIALFVPGGFGGGDIKLMGACGLYLGWSNAVLAFFIGVVIGGVAAIRLILKKKKGRKDMIPFGPPLCVGVAAAMFAGDFLIDYYIVSILNF